MQRHAPCADLLGRRGKALLEQGLNLILPEQVNDLFVGEHRIGGTHSGRSKKKDQANSDA